MPYSDPEKQKGQRQDIEKAIHYLNILLEEIKKNES